MLAAPDPIYPADLLAAANPPRASVTVSFVITTDGGTTEIEVDDAVDPSLAAAAREAVEGLRYEPARYRGSPVEISTRITLEFVPPDKRAPEASKADAGSRPKAGRDEGAAGKPAEASAPGATDTSKPELLALESTLRGSVLEAGQRTPIAGATLLVVPETRGAPTGQLRYRRYGAIPEPAWRRTTRADADGKFSLRSPTGEVQVVITAPGFERLDYIEALQPDQDVTVKYYLQRLPDNPYRTVVRSAKAQREEVARRTIVAEEITNLPGTQGDALKALQNFPGVARAPFGLGLLAIRGTGPNDSAVFLGWHEIPQLFHFGGLTSVFNSDILERIDFVPGNFDSRYGDAVGGIVDVQPRAGRRDGYHGYVDADLFDAGFLVEGRLGKGSFAIAGRRSYIDLILPRVIPKDAGINFTLAPRYWDDQILFDYPVGGGQLSVRVFGSSDRLKLLTTGPNEVDEDDRNRVENRRYFHRADLVYEKRQGPWEFLITPSYRYDQFLLNIFDTLGLTLSAHNFNVRAEVGHRFSPRARLRVGTELQTTFFKVDVEAPPLAAQQGGSTNTRLTSNVTGNLVTPAVYTTLELSPTDRFTLYPGARFSYYAGAFRSPSVEPRLRAAWQVADKTTLKAGVGLFNQGPQPVQVSDLFGNPRLGLERAVQTSVGVSQALPFDINLDGTVFFTQLWDQVAPSSELVIRPDGRPGPETFANTQLGRAYGLEVLLRKELTGRLFGWVAYTLNRSERKLPGAKDYTRSSFDQTHILTAVAVWRLPKHWQIGGRFRLVSGNPTTPISGAIFEASSGGYRPQNGPLNSDRLPLFHQLDLRVDKSFVWRRLELSLYLDIQNVYNHQNVEVWNYSFDYTSRAPIAGLPIIPSVGTKLAF